jgi:hypothetical protein
MSIDDKIPTVDEINRLARAVEMGQRPERESTNKILNYLVDGGCNYALAVYTPEGKCDDKQRADICGFVEGHIARIGKLAGGMKISEDYRGEVVYFLKEFSRIYAEANKISSTVINLN